MPAADDGDVQEEDLQSEKVKYLRPMTELEHRIAKAMQRHGGKSKFAQLAVSMTCV